MSTGIENDFNSLLAPYRETFLKLFLDSKKSIPANVFEPLRISRPSPAPSVGLQPNFSTEIELQLGATSIRTLFNEIQAWINNHHKKDNNPIKCTTEEFVRGVRHADTQNRISLATEQIQGNGTQAAPQYWMMTYCHPQNDLQDRTWQTRIGITNLGNNRYTLSLINEHSLKAEYLGDPPALPPLTTPKIIRTILNLSEENGSWIATSGATPISGRAIYIGHHEINDFVSAIKDPCRKLLLVVLSPSHSGRTERNTKYSLDPETVAKRLAGVASVMALETNDLASGVTYLGNPIDPSIVPFNGWSAVYWPAVSGSNNQPLMMHKFSDTDLEDDPDTILSNWHLAALRYNVNIQNAQVQHGDTQIIRSADDMEAIKLTQLRQKILDTATQPVGLPQEISSLKIEMMEYIDMLEVENQRLTAERNGLSSQVYDLKIDLEIARNDAISANARADATQVSIANLKIQRSPSELTHLREPSNIQEAIEYIGKRYATRVVLHKDAIDGAKEMTESKQPLNSGTLNRAIKLIMHLATTLWVMKFETENITPRLFQNKTGFELAFSEGSGVAKDNALKAHRTVIYKDKLQTAYPHVKLGSQPGNMLRIHFFFDEFEKKVVIAKVVDHLPILSSRKDGSRP